MSEERRGSFSGKLGFVLCTAGAAIGLGCLWRFPNLAAKYGGGCFIICYIVLLFILGAPLFATQVAIGRKAQTGVLGAFKKLSPKFGFIGYLCFLVGLLVQPYYTVVCAEIIKYTTMYITGQGETLANPQYFTSFTSLTFEPLIWLAVFTILTMIFVLLGVKNGIEKFCKIIMPIETILLVILVIYSLTLPNALEGVAYYLCPDITRFSAQTVFTAMGQVFYSLGIGFGVLIIYGSYLSKKENLVKSALIVPIFTFIIAFLAGMLIIPGCYIFTSGNPELITNGSIFETLPIVLNSLPFGNIIGTIFFLLLTFAALSANVAGLEAMTASINDRFHVSRKKTAILLSVYVLIVGTLISLGYGVLDWMKIGGMNLLEFFDFVSGTLLLPVIALLICIMIGYAVKPHVILNELKLVNRFTHDKLYCFMIKIFCPACILIIFIYNIISLLI